MNDLESQLTRLPLRTAPTEWRQHILQATHRAHLPAATAAWWSAWLRPQRLAFAAAWLIILALRLAQPHEKTGGAYLTAASWREHLAAEKRLMAQLFDPPAVPAPKAPPPHGAMLPRRQPSFT